ncbi:MerR family transcriptional regulator [Polyangium mundeleinium]|uniref:MerR family transcriptional regulator n=1 Tax=Polyangium mundeleinium TaxID=2995306 RepID=A0ABT5EZN3_9BACT|nr:MerR family transcriptional regulator [Polyangium mundeleinium]MDC0746367.1 MerR family transcriptional regulator [Polyangium mundeleinium]
MDVVVASKEPARPAVGGFGGEARPARAKPPSVDRDAYPYRMKDLCERTGLPRQVVHFYIQQGLVPEGHKTGRNMAYYGEEHLARILLVRKLQHERFLPLRAIKALLEERDEAFSPAQRRFVHEVKSRLSRALGARADNPATADANELIQKLGLSRKDLEDMVDLGLIAAAEEHDASGRARLVVASDDTWILETFAEFRRIGFNESIGFSARDILMYEEAMGALFAREAKLLAERLSSLAPEQAATMVERALPLINAFLVRYHDALARNFLATL